MNGNSAMAATGAELAQIGETLARGEPIDALSETCGTCRFRRVAKDLSGMCRRNPPTGHVIAQPGPVQGTMQLQTIGVYPPVGPTDPACGEWKAKR